MVQKTVPTALERNQVQQAADIPTVDEFQDSTNSSMNYVPMKNFADYLPRFFQAYKVPKDDLQSIMGNVFDDETFTYKSTWTEVPQGEQQDDDRRSKRYQTFFLARQGDTVAILHAEYKLNYKLKAIKQGIQ